MRPLAGLGPRRARGEVRHLAVLIAGTLSLAVPALAQQGMVRAPLPPERPFDLDLPASRSSPVVEVPARPSAAAPSAASEKAPEAQDDEGPEWPKPVPGQPQAEPQFDANEKPDQPGISTDPGTSTVCLPVQLKSVLSKIAFRYGAVKVTSTWRPPWRARRGSYHKRCEAMDFRVPGIRPREVLEYARTLPETGGNKVYWNGLIHIDTGPRRPW